MKFFASPNMPGIYKRWATFIESQAFVLFEEEMYQDPPAPPSSGATHKCLSMMGVG